MAHNPNADKLMKMTDYSELIRYVETQDPKYPAGIQIIKYQCAQLANWLKEHQITYRGYRYYKPYAAAMTDRGEPCAFVKGAYNVEIYKLMASKERELELSEYYGSISVMQFRTIADAVRTFNKIHPNHHIVTFSSAIPKDE